MLHLPLNYCVRSSLNLQKIQVGLMEIMWLTQLLWCCNLITSQNFWVWLHGWVASWVLESSKFKFIICYSLLILSILWNGWWWPILISERTFKYIVHLGLHLYPISSLHYFYKLYGLSISCKKFALHDYK